MKKAFYFAAAAALLIASSAARAGDGFSFTVDGQKMRVEAPRNCNSLSCLSVTKNGSPVDMKDMNFKGKKSDDDDVVTSSPSPAPPASPAPPRPADTSNARAVSAPAAERDSERVTGLPSTPTAGTVADQPDRLKKLDEATAPAPAAVANSAPLAPPAPPMQEAATAAATPLGLWQTEDNKGNNKGNVRVEQCGPNLCGYGEKNGEKTKDMVLINMKPSPDNSKWTGRIHDPNSGKDYDSTIAMAGPNQLKVQGCALGGMLCGGTTWKRIN